jgi:multiple sugar transport system substrate-binding protein
MAFHATDAINFWEVTRGWAGTDPSSLNHLFPPRGTAKVEDYTATGFNKDDAEQYITAYGENLFSMPIYETYLRIPGTDTYEANILDARLSQALTGQSKPQDALDQVAADWNKVTDDYGRDKLLKIYQDSIGYKP